MNKAITTLVPVALALLVGMSGCASDISNDCTHTPITGVKPVLFKPVFEIGEKKISGEGEAGGFFNFDFDFEMPSLSFCDSSASNSAAFVEASIYENFLEF